MVQASETSSRISTLNVGHVCPLLGRLTTSLFDILFSVASGCVPQKGLLETHACAIWREWAGTTAYAGVELNALLRAFKMFHT